MVTKHILGSRDEWLHARGKRIGGSDAASIINCNPYMTNADLWDIKTGRKAQEDISDKPYVKYGTEAEKYLRELFKLDYPEYTVFYEENNLFLNDRYPWAHASLDGWLKDEKGRLGIWECKTTEIRNASGWDKWDQTIPDNYFCQVLHYMAVVEAEFVVLKAQIKYMFQGETRAQIRHYFMDRSEVADQIEYLVNAEKEFWNLIESDERPALFLPEI